MKYTVMRYNPLKEDSFTIGEFLDFAESKGWNRESAAKQLYSMLTTGNVTGAYHATLRYAMRELSDEKQG